MDLLQWNVNGIRVRFPRIQASIQHSDPAIIGLQETHSRPSHSLNLSGFTAHRYYHTDREGVSGGTAILVRHYI
jgi:exonuclease III